MVMPAVAAVSSCRLWVLLAAAAMRLASVEASPIVGAACDTARVGPGECKLSSRCPWAAQQREQGHQPRACGHVGIVPVVCCPLLDTTRAESVEPPQMGATTSVAQAKCNEYASLVYVERPSPVLPRLDLVDTCSFSASLIVGGVEAAAREFPHMALVGYAEGDGVSWKCGGSLISPYFVLSAAHCRLEQGAPWVLLGDLRLDSDSDGASPELISVSEFIVHPAYRPPAKYNDIALLRLAWAATMTDRVRPACLHTEPTVREDVFLVTGWGSTSPSFYGGTHVTVTAKAAPSAGHNELLKAVVDRVESFVCREHFPPNVWPFLPEGFAEQSQLCAGGGRTDTCHGDSGGPLQVVTRNESNGPPEPYCMYKIVGVTSFGRGCASNSPGVYTRVYHYLPWIEEIVWSTPPFP